MDFNLQKDLVFFDIESTGLNVIRDRIVQIALIKYVPGQLLPLEKEMLINPGIPISEESMRIHGITPEDVRNKPTFAQVAQELYDFIGQADLAGYNSNRFDLPLLMEEFARVGMELDMDGRKRIDVQRIFYKMEPRTLRAAHRFYCGEDLVNAHDALADVQATVNVLKGQLQKYADVDYEDGDGEIVERPVQNDMKALHAFTNDNKTIDATQRLKYNHDGVAVFNFGKYIGQPVGRTLYEDRQYYHWMLEKEFSHEVKQAIRKLMKEYEQSVKSGS